jgi:hypothetical protein
VDDGTPLAFDSTMAFIAPSRNVRTIIPAGIFLVSASLAMPAAHAQTPSAFPKEATQVPSVTYSSIGGTVQQAPVRPAPWPLFPTTPAITQPQLQAFAELLGETDETVWRRLWSDPGLVLIAAAAAQARMDRERSGRVMTGAGFTILGVGATLGFGIVLGAGLGRSLAWDCDSTCKAKYDGQESSGIALGLISAGIGLALAIPGIVKLARKTEIETEAVSSYQLSQSGHASIRPPEFSRSLSAIASGRTADLPLLSLSF